MFDEFGGCERIEDFVEPLLLPEPPPDEDAVALPEHFGGRCCTRARAVACSCAFHWVCDAHGDQHLGTHD
jgi:hypothetical protein